MPTDIQLYDTMSRSVRILRPLDGKVIRFYCCGPTVYGPAHIGNFRTFISQDILRRTLELAGWPTKHVRNITDVDDKTIRQSQAAGQSLQQFTDHWLGQFRTDCAALNLLPPHVEPSAVEHIPQQINLIETLVAKQHAYRTDDGSVYFRIDSFPDYGRLSHVKERELAHGTNSGGKTNLADEYERESLADFALWKAHKPADGPYFWSSPWGKGRPGWHLECSCMSMRYLGESFDLHGGGVDLVFPHHENEIAQSEAATGKPFVAHWFHTTHLMVENSKMSKSEGNLFTLQDLQEQGFSPMEVRYVLLASKYSQPMNFTTDSLHAARTALKKLARAAATLTEAELPYTQLVERVQTLGTDNPFHAAWTALCNDLNVSEALGQTFVALKELGVLSPQQRTAAWLGLQRIIQALGLVLPAVDDEPTTAIPAEVQELAAKRWTAKQAKNWQLADECRTQLTALGWSMQDGKDTYKLSPIDQAK